MAGLVSSTLVLTVAAAFALFTAVGAAVVGTVVAFFDLGQGAGALAALGGLALLTAHMRRADLELAPT